VKALPKLAKGANDSMLAQLFTDHLEETKGQVLRLKNVFELLGERPTGEHCSGMEGVIEEGSDALEKGTEDASFDSGLIGAALRTEHYEIAGYEACIAMAKALNETEIAAILTANLDEELAAAEKVTSAGQAILKQAAAEPEQDTGPKTGKEKYSDKKSREDESAVAVAVGKHG
jgi:ferritin-like metal-binding protein YciE